MTCLAAVVNAPDPSGSRGFLVKSRGSALSPKGQTAGDDVPLTSRGLGTCRTRRCDLKKGIA
jgi:hypothetical protein